MPYSEEEDEDEKMSVTSEPVPMASLRRRTGRTGSEGASMNNSEEVSQIALNPRTKATHR